MKYIFSKNRALNLANIDEITVSCNYLKVTTGGGLNAREINFIYGGEAELVSLLKAIMGFIAGEGNLFDCDKFLGR